MTKKNLFTIIIGVVLTIPIVVLELLGMIPQGVKDLIPLLVSIGMLVTALISAETAMDSSKISKTVAQIARDNLSISVRPFVLAEIDSQLHGGVLDVHMLRARNIGNGSAHNIVFEVKQTLNGETVSEIAKLETLSVDEPNLVYVQTPSRLPKSDDKGHIGEIEIHIAYDDILDERHERTQIIGKSSGQQYHKLSFH